MQIKICLTMLTIISRHTTTILNATFLSFAVYIYVCVCVCVCVRVCVCVCQKEIIFAEDNGSEVSEIVMLVMSWRA